ncbi:hypothetical protein, partial [Pseudaeromonas paramecii]|uniref:hypothetical protein n=1 Tax=Pseudaeromonas paramecii TaxID=2138166 RepID=UPI003CD098BF
TADDEGNITITTAQWSLVVDSASGEYDFTLLDNVLHDAVQGENWALDAFSIALGVTVEDADGDQVTDTVTLNVDVQDDIPVRTVAADDLTVEEDDLNNANAVGNNEDGSTDGHIAHGSLADNFAFGADGAGASKVVSVSYDGTPYTADDEGNITITTAQWSLVVDSASGEYDFTLLDNVLHDGVQGENWALDAFNIALGVTVEDADGDQVTDTVTLNVDVQDDI